MLVFNVMVVVLDVICSGVVGTGNDMVVIYNHVIA